MRRRFPIATLSTFRRAAKRDAGVGVPSKAWRRALTPTEKSASSLLDHGVAETNETFATKQRRLLPAVHGREQKVENLNDRIDAVEELRTTARANIQEVEETNAETSPFFPWSDRSWSGQSSSV